ncbi:MAG: hypothetical protein WCF33_05895 [Pseudonocardiaceae bacterium]
MILAVRYCTTNEFIEYRLTWRHLWRRGPFPCAVWRQIRSELLGRLTIAGYSTPHHHARSAITGLT